ncbi:MAG: hAT transposon family protein, partial [Methanosarcinales archaeon]
HKSSAAAGIGSAGPAVRRTRSGAQPTRRGAAPARSASATIGGAAASAALPPPGHSLFDASLASLLIPDAVDESMTPATPGDVGNKRLRGCVAAPPRRTARPHAPAELGDSYADAELGAASHALWEAVDTSVDGATVAVVQEIERWGAAALETFNEHVEPLVCILRARLALYPWHTMPYNILVGLSSLGWLPEGKLALGEIELELKVFEDNKCHKAYAHVARTHAGVLQFWQSAHPEFPQLATIALRLLALPVLSAAVERGFSIQTKRTSCAHRLRGSPVYLHTAGPRDVPALLRAQVPGPTGQGLTSRHQQALTCLGC